MEWATCAADSLRSMCKHLLDLKRARTKWVTPDLQQLLDMIRDDGETSSPSQLEVQKPSLGFADVADTRASQQHNSADHIGSVAKLCTALCSNKFHVVLRDCHRAQANTCKRSGQTG